MIALIESKMGLWLAKKIQSNFKTLLLEVGGLGVDMLKDLLAPVTI